MRFILVLILTFGLKNVSSQIFSNFVLSKIREVAWDLSRNGTSNLTEGNLKEIRRWLIDHEMEEGATAVNMQNLRQLQRQNNVLLQEKYNEDQNTGFDFYKFVLDFMSADNNETLSEKFEPYRKKLEKNVCYKNIFSLFEEENKGALISMLDASAKIPQGLLFGNIVNMGNFDQCLNIAGNFTGKYCTIEFRMQNDSLLEIYKRSRFSMGVCIPSKCNSWNSFNFVTELNNFLSDFFDIPYQFVFDEDLCTTFNEEHTFSKGQRRALYIFLVYGIVIFIATICDIFMSKELKSSVGLWLIFSLHSNIKKLFSIKANTENDNLRCLNGLKVLSIFWVMALNTLQSFMAVPLTNIADLKITWEKVVILAGLMASDTFLCISGFLVVYLFFSSKKSLNFFEIYIKRYLRLTIPLAFLMFYLYNISLFGSGPIWKYTKKLEQNCLKNWWVNMFYMQNYYRDDQCLNHGWYLAVDMHMNILAPYILFGLLKYQKTTLISLVVLVLTSNAYSAWLSFQYKELTLLDLDNFYKFFAPTHFRGSTWLIGAIFGYIMYKIKDKKINLSKYLVYFIWFISTATLVGIISYHKYLADTIEKKIKLGLNTNTDNIHKAFFNSFLRPIWAVSQCSIIGLCIKGYCGFLNQFLSSNIFNFLAKISYSAYLVHMGVVGLFFLQIRAPQTYTAVALVQNLASISVVTIFFSVVWTLSFELPIRNLLKILFRK